ncbi:Homeodomain-like domain-containing protein [Thermanaeromonas toyohensis ToBE]|uniref:Homeodomain-like domain-containing protein n=1 Tax=Thermanaeromonas toyohensis ToBE TaxID=698762 RepID=A0A1W1VWL5_9FIRM|nr:HNH endonuclease [Thermanaeromonas toyohensis]SMB97718.1 Homeodomain-like domain-containing protein [Thermanaeromonas toyohensis ToBE]
MPVPLPKEIRDMAISLYQNGYTLTEVGDALGIDRITVYRWLVKYGIKRRPNHARPGVMARERNPQWKGGRSRKDGYIVVNVPNSKRYLPEHRIIIEQHLGRKLQSDEIVHHVNERRDDNRLENLVVIKRADHMRLHQTKYSKADLLILLAQLAVKLGRLPRTYDIRAHKGELPSLVTYYRRFGSFINAIKELENLSRAGVPVPAPLKAALEQLKQKGEGGENAEDRA